MLNVSATKIDICNNGMFIRTMKIVYIEHIYNWLTNQLNTINWCRPCLKHAPGVYS